MVLPAWGALLTLAACTAARAADFDPWTESAVYEVEYLVDLAPLILAGHKYIRVWLPTPAETQYQQVRSKDIQSPWPHRQTQDDYGNQFVYIEPTAKVSPPYEVVLRYVVQREPDAGIRLAEAKADTPLDPQRYLGPQSRIPLDNELQQLAKRETRTCKTDAEKIRAIYDYVLRNMRYDKSGKGWGQGDVHWACTAGYGNCTDFHSLFMGLARAEKIPARFFIGFPVAADKAEGDVAGYHCWAEAYDPQRGWIPVDASEAWKSKRHNDYFGRLPSDRVAFTVGRDLVLEPRQAGQPLNFFVYPYAEADDQPVDSVPWKLHYRRVAPAPEH